MSVVLDSGLRDALKALRLTGILATLDDRLTQARDARLGHTEVLQLLLEDELARRQTAALQRRLSRARFETAAEMMTGAWGWALVNEPNGSCRLTNCSPTGSPHRTACAPEA